MEKEIQRKASGINTSEFNKEDNKNDEVVVEIDSTKDNGVEKEETVKVESNKTEIEQIDFKKEDLVVNEIEVKLENEKEVKIEPTVFNLQIILILK